MKKTKIICTMGPNEDNREIMVELAKNGMDIARFNFSHGSHEEQKTRLDQLKSVRDELGLPIAALLDTKGPEIRTGMLKDEKKVTLVEGQEYTLTTRKVVGDENIGHINYAGLPEDVAAGNKILIDDGLIELLVTSVEGTEIHCTVVNGGELGQRKGVNVPKVKVKLPALTEKDKEDIWFGIEQGFDFIAASFVRNADAIVEIKQMLEVAGSNIKVIAKIENEEGIENLDAIIEASDGIMVARGDMGVEIPAEQVPFIQKTIIRKCNEACKPVITATQMLDSMIRNPRPTRAEVADVANAIYDGTDAIMLSGETAAGKYPIEAVTMMGEIAEQTERYLKFEDYRDGKALEGKLNVSAAVGSAAVSMVEHIKAACIVTPTMSGQTARLISNLRPSVPIYGVTPYEWARRKMQLYWGVRPVTGYEEDSTENIISHAMYMVRREELVERGDMVIFTAGDPATNEVTGEGYMTNMLHIIQAK